MKVDRKHTYTLLIAILAALIPLLPAQVPQKPAPPNRGALTRADAAFRAGFAARQAGNLPEARARFAEAARLAPRIPEAHEALGAVLGELDRKSTRLNSSH